MATAPRPGTTPTAKARRLAVRVIVDGRTWVLHFGDLSPMDDLAARQATGMPISPFLQDERFGTDTFAVLWWMARRKDGEPRLRFSAVASELPGYLEMAEWFEEGRIGLETVEEGVIDAEAEEVPHPLGSGGG